MRRTIAVAVFLCCVLLPLFAETAGEDVVYLKDGSVLRGTIKNLTEQDLTIVTGQGLEFTVPMSNVDRFERKAAGSAGSSAAPAAGTPATGTAMKPLAVEANLLGLLQFGPYFRLQVRLLDNLYFAPHVRVGYAGALGWLIFDTGDIGAGASFLYFFPSESPHRLYMGSFTEVSYNLNDELNINVGTNMGYRWRFPGGSYWNTGFIAGFSYNTWSETFFFFGMLELAWGFEF